MSLFTDNKLHYDHAYLVSPFSNLCIFTIGLSFNSGECANFTLNGLVFIVYDYKLSPKYISILSLSYYQQTVLKWNDKLWLAYYHQTALKVLQ